MTVSSPRSAPTESIAKRDANARRSPAPFARTTRNATYETTIAAQTISRPTTTSDSRQPEGDPPVVRREHRRADPGEADAVAGVDLRPQLVIRELHERRGDHHDDAPRDRASGITCDRDDAGRADEPVDDPLRRRFAVHDRIGRDVRGSIALGVAQVVEHLVRELEE